MTPEQIRDYEYPGVYKDVDRTPETPAPVCTLAPDDDTSFQEGDARWTRHTVDVDRAPMSDRAPERSSGAEWAWVAMGALVGLYIAWRLVSNQ